MIWSSIQSFNISHGEQFSYVAALEEHLFIEAFKKIALRLKIVNVPDNEQCLPFIEFLRRLKKYLLHVALLYQRLLHVIHR